MVCSINISLIVFKEQLKLHTIQVYKNNNFILFLNFVLGIISQKPQFLFKQIPQKSTCYNWC